MAQRTVKLYGKVFGFVDSERATEVIDISASTEVFMTRYYSGSGDLHGKILYFTIDSFPSSLKHKIIYFAKAVFSVKNGEGASDFEVHKSGSFNPSTLMWNNRPDIGDFCGISGSINSTSYSNWADLMMEPSASLSASELSSQTSEAVRGGVCAIVLKSGLSWAYAFINPKTLTSGSTKPYIEVTYDDSTNVTSKITAKTYPSGNAVNPLSAQSFTWNYEKNGTYSCYGTTWTQKSATFYWKKSTESSYHSVAISGNTKSVTIPANTFPSGSTIQWYVSGVDEYNTTTQTSVYSFSTVTTQITPDSYPSGNSVDNRTAKSFTWHFASSAGNFGQSSARLYWRVQDAETWNSIAASGTTQSLSVPAYTFPSGSTIEWYLSGVDATGTASTSATATFQTLAYTLAVTTAPSGSNVGTQSAIPFTWTLANTQGAATQKSAVLYWRVQGAAEYTAITNSTSTKSISVPANTFPTASTIQWYLSVTASDNTVKTTSAATFTTVTPTVTPTVYPSGNDVYSGADLTFKWKLASSAGDYAQESAVFYWRLTTSEEYTAISISGNTQQVTIPAITFPTNATVYWYVTAVDIGNHSSQTSVQNFSTSTTQITPQSSPTSGYVNPRNAITFSWYFAASGGSIPQGSAALYWRVQGQSNWTQVSASGSTTSVTIPANTFQVASVIEWYIAGSDSSGTSSQSSVYSFSTTAATVYAVVKSPISSGVDGSVPITFQWTLTTADGYPAKRVILQWKLPTEDEQHWHTIIDTTTAITQYTVDGGTFQPGEINWRVQAYNVDNVIGPESRASFICIIAPTITALTASDVPFSVIAWQAGDQQGYQLEIDGVKFGPYPGTEKQFAVPDYLRDGVHVIRLRVLGSVDLWSEWAETSVAIENSPGNPITAQAETGINVTLEWQASDTETDFYVYRDGKLIGRTGNTRFVDRFSLGTHEYVVINRLTDGNYSLSDTLTETTEVQNIYLSSTDGLVDVDILYRIKGDPDPEHTESRETLMNRLAGHDYAALTRSRFREHTIRCTAVFLYTEEGKDEAFLKLLGEEIVAKIRDGTCCAGVIESCTRRPKKTYYMAYDFTIRQIEWEDFDDTQ